MYLKIIHNDYLNQLFEEKKKFIKIFQIKPIKN